VLETMGTRGDVRGASVLYLCAEGARDVLPAGLRAIGCDVTVVPVYRSVATGAASEELRAALSGGAAAVIFASASAVRGYVDAVGEDSARVTPAVSIGPVTTDAIHAAGIPLGAEAAEASVAALVDATRRFVTA
jgi:uroporphyrinogen III methyltransferase/synthase